MFVYVTFIWPSPGGSPCGCWCWSLYQGPVFLFVFCPWARLRWAEMSWAQVYRFRFFLFLCELSSPWASSRNDRWSWANWEGVSRTLSKAELCNNGPYLDARTDRISPHTSLLPSHIPKKIRFQWFLRVKARSPLTNLPWYADRLLRVIKVCFVTSYTQRPLRRLHSRKLCK